MRTAGRWRVRGLVVVLAGSTLLGCGGADRTPPPPAATSPATPAITAGAGPTSAAPALPATARVVRIAVAAGQVSRESARVMLKRGATLRLEVTADVADTVHVHGYDLKSAVAPGRPAVLTFELTIPGVYVVELEEARLDLVELAVR